MHRLLIDHSLHYRLNLHQLGLLKMEKEHEEVNLRVDSQEEGHGVQKEVGQTYHLKVQ